MIAPLVNEFDDIRDNPSSTPRTLMIEGDLNAHTHTRHVHTRANTHHKIRVLEIEQVGRVLAYRKLWVPPPVPYT